AAHRSALPRQDDGTHRQSRVAVPPRSHAAMSLTSPNLADRDWRALMVAPRERMRESCPEWSDLSPGDPGVALIDVFAHLTEILIYRVNRIPEKAWVEFLRLLGLELRPATAAVAELEIVRVEEAPPGEIVVPAYTRV